MYVSICLSPNVFHRTIYSEDIKHELINLFASIKKNGFLIIDKEEKLVDLYYEYILKNEDDNIAKDMEILFSSFYSELRENLVVIGEGLEDFYIVDRRY